MSDLTCPVCNLEFKSRSGLWKHSRKHNINNDINKICGCRNSKVQTALLTYRNQFCSLIGKCALAYYDAHIYKIYKIYFIYNE
jgi:hypothetical protein